MPDPTGGRRGARARRLIIVLVVLAALAVAFTFLSRRSGQGRVEVGAVPPAATLA